jgi:hypothetical protein
MNKHFRLAALAVLALVLTSLCLAGPFRPHRPIHTTGCVLGCFNYCRAFGLATYKSCTSCYCYQPAPPVVGCSGGGCSGGSYGCDGSSGEGCEGCSGWGCGGWGGCGGGGCGGGGCGGGGC